MISDAHKIFVHADPNSAVDKLGHDGIIKLRRYFNKNGNVKLDFNVTDHGNSARHLYVPHSHDWDYVNGKIVHCDDRKASRAECIANEDIVNDKTGY